MNQLKQLIESIDKNRILIVCSKESTDNKEAYINTASILLELLGEKSKQDTLLVSIDIDELPNEYSHAINVLPSFLGFRKGATFDNPSDIIEGFVIEQCISYDSICV